MDRETVAFRIVCEACPARRKLVHLADFYARAGKTLSHGRNVVHLEGGARRSSRSYAEFFAGSVQGEGGVSEIELNPVVVEPLAGTQSHDLAVKLPRSRHVAYVICNKRKFLDHPARFDARAADHS